MPILLRCLLATFLLGCAWAQAAEAAPPGIVQTGTPRRFLFAGFPHGKPQPAQIAIVGLDGRPEWKHRTNNSHDGWVLANGNILCQDVNRIIELTRDHREVWSYDCNVMNGNEGRKVTIHAFQRLADGLTMIVEAGPARIIEVDQEGRLVRQIPLTVDTPNPVRDSRNARKLANGHYLVAHEGDGKVREYDGEGKVVWTHEVAVTDAKGRVIHAKVYSALRLPDGNTLIAAGSGARVIEVDPAGKEVWTLEAHELPGIVLGWPTQVERLANGNTIVVNCHAGPENPQVFEVTRAKQVVWSYNNWIDFGWCTPVFQALDEAGEVIR